MPGLLEQVDFQTLHIRSGEIERVEVLRETESHLVCRLVTPPGSLILKWFRSPETAVELHTYALLNRSGVDTLRVYQQGDQLLLLEDLQTSAFWRQATPADMHRAATGRAVADWYRTLHAAGKLLLQDASIRPAFLKPWVSVITPQAISAAGVAFGFQDLPVWNTALEKIESLVSSYLALPQTFNYTDFAMENLAVSRNRQAERRAVVFDYDCFATGAVFSDWRNVVYSLQGAARKAFMEAYGQVSEVERSLDEPLAILEGLVVAGQRRKIPGWAAPLVESVRSGELERSLMRALHA